MSIFFTSDILTTLEIEYQKGELKINGESYTFFQAISYLNEKCLTNWSVDLIIENRQTGIKSRGLYITPGAKVLYKAFEGLVSSSLNKKAFEHYELLSEAFSNVIYNGEYYSLQYNSIASGVESFMKGVSGKVIIKTYPMLHVSYVAPDKPLFKEEICTFDYGEISHSDATGFINLSWYSADGGGFQ